jgi:hypothetical protein
VMTTRSNLRMRILAGDNEIGTTNNEIELEN